MSRQPPHVNAYIPATNCFVESRREIASSLKSYILVSSTLKVSMWSLRDSTSRASGLTSILKSSGRDSGIRLSSSGIVERRPNLCERVRDRGKIRVGRLRTPIPHAVVDCGQTARVLRGTGPGGSEPAGKFRRRLAQIPHRAVSGGQAQELRVSPAHDRCRTRPEVGAGPAPGGTT